MRVVEQRRHGGPSKRLRHLKRLGKSLDTGVQQRRQHGVRKGRAF